MRPRKRGTRSLRRKLWERHNAGVDTTPLWKRTSTSSAWTSCIMSSPHPIADVSARYVIKGRLKGIRRAPSEKTEPVSATDRYCSWRVRFEVVPNMPAARENSLMHLLETPQRPRAELRGVDF